ncbi:MAG: twin-arginine translocase TatA/TatE family subunit [Deltaproteobacteria bacterium]|nr:twin-arginine translocase TatA/TatE family subunit [Deltaproteobacteria bacterium]
MFGLGFGEILIILVLALLLLGPAKLPEAAKQLGKGLRDFRKATDDLKQQFEGELYAEPPRPQRPKLAEPAAAAPGSPEAAQVAVPPGGVPATGAAPAATAENVPGLEAALAEPAAAPAPAPAPESAPAAQLAAGDGKGT